MKINDASIQKIIDHIYSKWGEKGQCPKCYLSSNMVFDKTKIRLFALTEYHQGTLVIGGDTIQIPIVPIFCKNCGYIELLHVGILDEAQKEKPETSGTTEGKS